MQRPVIDASDGASMFELAVVMLVSLSILIGAVAVGDLLLSSYRVSRVTDLAAYDHAIAPLMLREDGTVAVNRASIHSGLESLADRVKGRLEEAADVESSEYRIEISVGLIDVSIEDGRVRELSVDPSLVVQRGSLSISGNLERRTNLLREYERVGGARGMYCPYAVPIPSAAGERDAYLPYVALLGIRTFFSLEHSPTAQVLSSLGVASDDMVFDWKVIPLRGEFGGTP